MKAHVHRHWWPSHGGQRTCYRPIGGSLNNCYQTLSTEADRSRYVERAKVIRYARLAQARLDLRPQAIVCLGKTYWPDFREVLRLDDRGRDIEEGKVIAYDDARVVLAPHFAYGHLARARARRVTGILMGWRVSLP